MIVFTEANDTPAKIAHRYLGYNDASMASAIRKHNTNSFAWQTMGSSGYYAPDRAVWFPLSGDTTPSWERDAIIHEFDWLTTTQRAGLHNAMKNHIDIHDIVNAHHLSSMANFFMGAGTIALDASHSALEIRHDKMGEFAELIEQAKTQLGNIADATSQSVREQAAQAYKSTYQQLQHQYANYLNQLSHSAKHKLKQPYRAASKLRKQGWLLDDVINTKNMLRVVKFLKFTVVLGYFAMVIEGGYDTYETWDYTHSWEATAKTAAEVVTDIAMTALVGLAAVGALALLGITAPTWGACLIAGAAAATIGTWLDKDLINPLIEAT